MFCRRFFCLWNVFDLSPSAWWPSTTAATWWPSTTTATAVSSATALFDDLQEKKTIHSKDFEISEQRTVKENNSVLWWSWCVHRRRRHRHVRLSIHRLRDHRDHLRCYGAKLPIERINKTIFNAFELNVSHRLLRYY